MASIQDLCDAFGLTLAQERVFRKLCRATRPVKLEPNDKVPVRRLMQAKLAHEFSPEMKYAQATYIRGYGYPEETVEDHRAKYV